MTLKAPLISIAFLCLWFFIGPLALVAVAPLLWRPGPSRDKLPSLNGALILTILFGVLLGIVLNQMISEDAIPPLLTTVADLQIVQTAASRAVSEGRGEMSLIFALELLVSLLFVPVILILTHREGSFRSKLDAFVDEMRAMKGTAPYLFWLFSVVFVVGPLFIFYFDDDLTGRTIRRLPFILPIFPILWFLVAAIAWRFGASMLSNKESKK